MAQTLGALPLPREVVRAAFEVFRECGELPDEPRLAVAVVRRARHGVELTDAGGSEDALARQLRQLLNAPPRPDDAVMQALYDEAVCESEAARLAARDVLRMLSDLGLDVSEPVFARFGIELEMPAFGPVGLHLLGFPECLVVAPYEEQARRLIERYGVLRMRAGKCSERWFDRLGEAIRTFRTHGELPADALLRDVVLADAELLCLIQHHRGEDVGARMAALQAIAAGSGREDAVGGAGESGRSGATLAGEQ